MRGFLTIVLSIFLMSPAIGLAVAQENEDFTFIMDMRSYQKDCNRETAKEINFKQLFDPVGRNKSNPIYRGECVRVRGNGTHRILFENDKSPYFRPLRNILDSSDKKLRHQVGLLGEAVMEGALDWEGGHREIDVIGRLYDCEDHVFMGSYCHYTFGPFIALASVKASKVDRVRYVGRRARRRIWEI